MTIDRSQIPGSSGSSANTPDAVSTLVRTHAKRPPYDAVDWDGLAARVVTGATPELERRRKAIRWLDGGAHRSRVHAWWEIAAGWARPALAAAVTTIAMTGTLLLATWSTSSAGSSDGMTLAASTDGVEAVMLDNSATVTSGETLSAARDSLFAAIVNPR